MKVQTVAYLRASTKNSLATQRRKILAHFGSTCDIVEWYEGESWRRMLQDSKDAKWTAVLVVDESRFRLPQIAETLKDHGKDIYTTN